MVQIGHNHPTSVTDMKEQLEELIREHKHYTGTGQVATYIPELGRANRDHLAISIRLVTGELIEAGDVDVMFTIQSISKVLTLALALMDHNEQVVFDKVGMEPTGDPFNSIVKLETISPNKPLNPMINAGAIAVTSLLKGVNVEEKLSRLLAFIQQLSGNPTISYNRKVAQSESETADLNHALAYFMREHRVIEGDIEEVLQLYFKQCAIEVCCRDVAAIGAVFANNGLDITTGKQLIPLDIARLCKTFMVTCGMYNASGEFAIKVGFPSKSGVSGGVMSSVPHQMGIGVLGPALDKKGNSVAGVKLLEALSEKRSLSIF